MRRYATLIAIFFFLLPLFGRGLWFYRGIFTRSTPVSQPDYASFTAPQPAASTPLPVAAAPAESVSTVILFDLAHSNQYSMSELEPFTQALQTRNGIVNVNEDASILVGDLKRADAYVILVPFTLFTQSEVAAIRDFTDRGGKLLVILDPTRSGVISTDYGYTKPLRSPVDTVNQLLSDTGIVFQDDYVYNLVENEGNFRNVYATQFSKSALTENLKKLVFYSATSILGPKANLIEGDQNTFSSLTDQSSGFGLAAASDDNTLAVGDLSFMIHPFYQAADNQQFIANVATFLTGEARQRSLRDFPNLFDGPVEFLNSSEDESLNADWLGSILPLQNMLRQINVESKISAEIEPGNDSIVLGTYDQIETELADLLAPFEIEVLSETAVLPETIVLPTPEASTATPEATATPAPAVESDAAEQPEEDTAGPDLGGGLQAVLQLPDVGKIDTDHLGLVLYHSGSDKNILVLLADSNENLKALATKVAEGGLSGCSLQGAAALCPLASP